MLARWLLFAFITCAAGGTRLRGRSPPACIQRHNGNGTFERCWDELTHARAVYGAMFQDQHTNNFYAVARPTETVAPDLWHKVQHAAQYHALGLRPNTPAHLWYIGGNKVAQVAQDYMKLDTYARVHVFEPMPLFKETLHNSIGQHKEVHIHPFGLGKQAHVVHVPNQDKATSMFSSACAGAADGCQTLYIRDAATTLVEVGLATHGVTNVLYTNCEGCEVEVLETLINHDMLHHFDVVHTATHLEDVPDIIARWCRIREHLAYTHEYVFGAPFAQERWRRVR